MGEKQSAKGMAVNSLYWGSISLVSKICSVTPVPSASVYTYTCIY